MGKVMRHTLGASLNIRHNLSSSKGPKPLQLKLLTTYIPKTSAFTLAFSTSQRLRTTRASARTFFTFRHYITSKGLLEGTLQAGTSAVSDKLLDLVGLGGKSAADKGKDTRDYLAAAFPELNAWERAGADASSAGMVDAGFE